MGVFDNDNISLPEWLNKIATNELHESDITRFTCDCGMSIDYDKNDVRLEKCAYCNSDWIVIPKKADDEFSKIAYTIFSSTGQIKQAGTGKVSKGIYGALSAFAATFISQFFGYIIQSHAAKDTMKNILLELKDKWTVLGGLFIADKQLFKKSLANIVKLSMEKTLSAKNPNTGKSLVSTTYEKQWYEHFVKKLGTWIGDEDISNYDVNDAEQNKQTKMKKCPHCASDNPIDADKCSGCGASFRDNDQANVDEDLYQPEDEDIVLSQPQAESSSPAAAPVPSTQQPVVTQPSSTPPEDEDKEYICITCGNTIQGNEMAENGNVCPNCKNSDLILSHKTAFRYDIFIKI